MHDIKTIGVGGGGRLFGGSGGDRRLRQHHPHQGLKCPRCDSLNTKFCYYNNYNLSQPRHFCKSCRRYWTKGGVLRNVPVGGGCRKTKRSSSKPRPTASSSDAASAAPHGRKSNSRSSSESSSLTASATAAPDVASSAVSSNSAPSSALLNFPSSRMFNFPQTANASSGGDTPAPLTDHLSIGRGIFPAEVGSFTSMMTASCDPSLMEFNFAGISESPYGLQLQSDGKVVPDESTNNQQQWTHQQGRIITGEATTMPEDLKVQFPLDQTAQIDHLSGNHSGLETLDWRGGVSGGDQELFDLSYWNQPQWTTDSDQILYLP